MENKDNKCELCGGAGEVIENGFPMLCECQLPKPKKSPDVFDILNGFLDVLDGSNLKDENDDEDEL